MIEILLLPFVACIILTGIHAYLGMHIIERGVIFVDLALAQIAALGALIGFVFGIELHTTGSYFFSLGTALMAALFLSWVRKYEKEIQQEAVIGILYVFATVGAVLILSKAPSEAEHIKQMLVGNILFVKFEDVIKIAILYSVIGIFYFVFNNNFFAITRECADCEKKINVQLWDFLFYATFGAVVTSSVEIAGVLLVFSYLIVPVISAMMFFTAIKARLITAWIIGIIGSIMGMVVSVIFDLPTGASIVFVFGILFGIMLIIKVLNKKIYKYNY